ncbi:MAG TPA: phosphoribosylformylglycinamidine synthase [Candidatus Saccharimonadales bacterium]|nr:phosphoribosylformylglycinamidine synthase [Candidatus Saccharimonadales bacterium]
MQVHYGGSALSSFRRAKLLAKIQGVDPSITHLEARYIHFADVDRTLTPDQSRKLEALLNYGEPGSSLSSGTLCLVVPRPGTISPWSSKATDIVHNSGLIKINRLERGIAYYLNGLEVQMLYKVQPLLYDRMTETILNDVKTAGILFEVHKPKPLKTISLGASKLVLRQASQAMGLPLEESEIDYLYEAYQSLGREPTDIEIMMFAQVNSEHCRHKIFNADWVVDGQKQSKSLFKMIQNTYETGGQNVLSAYHDNAAIIKGPIAGRFFYDGTTGYYEHHKEPVHSVIKVETHNHPTAIAPVPGAATGVGGEIRDEAATGRGARSKMGLVGYTVSNLQIPGAEQPWERKNGKPDTISSPLDIMLEGPIGGAGFANEFGRPNVLGYFRTYEQELENKVWGYHKPIMIAGGLGNIRHQHVAKKKLQADDLIIQLGGPAMLIGLGGGGASSRQSGTNSASLDFASVQRGNGEMERRTNEVIDACWGLGDQNPIVSIHDVGAGGLSNALPELLNDSRRGAVFELRDIPSAEPGLSPLEIWCNEAQERYVLAIKPAHFKLFKKICERERCPLAVVGKVTTQPQLVVNDRLFKNMPIDLPLDVLFGNPPKMTREFNRKKNSTEKLDLKNIKVEQAVERILKLPAVGSKKFLITIGDRTVGGLITRDQMVGPWQVPVSDLATAAVSFDSQAGEAMAMGERSPLALINAPAAARMAVGEAITNIAASDIARLEDIKLSANWMATAGHGLEDQNLFESVQAIGEDFCPKLGLTIPVGKDSLSMKTNWQEEGEDKSVTSPVSLIVSSFSPVQDVTATLTPQLSLEPDTCLIIIDLGTGMQLGGSALAQVYNQTGDKTPDADPKVLKQFFKTFIKLKRQGKVLAYHDRSDGGIFVTLLEMAFASRCGLDLELSEIYGSILEKLFNEELGTVIQVKQTDMDAVIQAFGQIAVTIGRPTLSQEIVIRDNGKLVYKNSRAQLEAWWSDTSYQLQKLRDNQKTAEQEFATIQVDHDPGLNARVTFAFDTQQYDTRPKIAIFREQGVNGQVEMAAAFDKAGFTSVDVHLNDLLDGRHKLDDFVGIAACGGFSYGDVLGAGEGWAKSILFHSQLRDDFTKFFARNDSFSLGVCNGCQMLSALKDIIPGAEQWPKFIRNESDQFEARVVLTKIKESPSLFFKGMSGAILPVPTAHGEGRAKFDDVKMQTAALKNNLVIAQYVDNYGKITERYPSNPNGSPEGITALTSTDGRANIIMPHPERAFLSRQLSWHPSDWGEDSPWFKIFQNARAWVAQNE